MLQNIRSILNVCTCCTADVTCGTVLLWTCAEAARCQLPT